MPGARSLTVWKARHGTGARAQSQDHVEGFLTALGPDRGGLFLRGRGLDGHWAPAIHAVVYRTAGDGWRWRHLCRREQAVDNQIARNLTGSVDDLLAGKRYLIHDRDPLFTEFLRTAKCAG